jgi:hypothetical protein
MFTQYQLFAILVLKAFLKTDYRGVAQNLCDCGELRAAIELTEVPHFTTLHKASRRLLVKAPVRNLLTRNFDKYVFAGRISKMENLLFVTKQYCASPASRIALLAQRAESNVPVPVSIL